MIEARSPGPGDAGAICTGCRGEKQQPIAALVVVRPFGCDGVQLVLCEECGRDAANAIGFMCIRDGGWSKLEPRKRRPKPELK